MAFEYATNLTAIKNALDQYNTTTASPDLSANLTTRVRNVYLNDPTVVGMRGDIYPAIFVRVNKKKEDFASLGQTGPTRAMKEAVVNYDIIGFYRKDGAWTQNLTAMVELERMARNIEGVFEAEPTLSATAMWCQPVDTEFYGPFQTREMWIKAVVVSLEAHYLFR